MKTEYIDTDKAGVQKFYDVKIAKDGLFAFQDPESVTYYASLAGNAQVILDAGCGVGHLLIELKSNGKEVYGIDLSNEAINYASKRDLNVQVCSMDEMPFHTDAFDLVYSLGAIEHTPDMKKSLSEIMRVTREKAIIEVPLWQNNIDHAYLNESNKNIERWLTKDDWLVLFEDCLDSYIIRGGNLVVFLKKVIKCPKCGDSNVLNYFVQCYTDEITEFWRCNECRSVWRRCFNGKIQ